jgi:hypothetical protein
LQDSSVIESVDEYGDGVSVQILTVFPAMVLQQIRNTIAILVVRPRGIARTGPMFMSDTRAPATLTSASPLSKRRWL